MNRTEQSDTSLNTEPQPNLPFRDLPARRGWMRRFSIVALIVGLGCIFLTAYLEFRSYRIAQSQAGADVQPTGIHIEHLSGPPVVFVVISNIGKSPAENVRSDIRVSLYPPAVHDRPADQQRDQGTALPMFRGPTPLGSLLPATSKLISPVYAVVPLAAHEDDKLYVFGTLYYYDRTTATGRKRDWCFATHLSPSGTDAEPVSCR
jgi:hypothetical protein